MIINGVLIGVHVLISVALVVGILMKSGRGGGLSDMFGGGMSAGAGTSTVMERNLDRLVVVVALLFAVTTILLALRLG